MITKIRKWLDEHSERTKRPHEDILDLIGKEGPVTSRDMEVFLNRTKTTIHRAIVELSIQRKIHGYPDPVLGYVWKLGPRPTDSKPPLGPPFR